MQLAPLFAYLTHIDIEDLKGSGSGHFIGGCITLSLQL